MLCNSPSEHQSLSVIWSSKDEDRDVVIYIRRRQLGPTPELAPIHQDVHWVGSMLQHSLVHIPESECPRLFSAREWPTMAPLFGGFRDSPPLVTTTLCSDTICWDPAAYKQLLIKWKVHKQSYHRGNNSRDGVTIFFIAQSRNGYTNFKTKKFFMCSFNQERYQAFLGMGKLNTWETSKQTNVMTRVCVVQSNKTKQCLLRIHQIEEIAWWEQLRELSE